MAADLHARAVGPHVVGVVDDRRREPQHALLHAVEHGELDRARPLGLEAHVTTPAYALSAGWPPRWAYNTVLSRGISPRPTRSIIPAIDFPS